MLIRKLIDNFQVEAISFDLEDCDKVLRVEGDEILPSQIIELVTAFGYHCEVLS